MCEVKPDGFNTGNLQQLELICITAARLPVSGEVVAAMHNGWTAKTCENCATRGRTGGLHHPEILGAFALCDEILNDVLRVKPQHSFPCPPMGPLRADAAEAFVMSGLADKFDLLPLADAAQLLHCSKAQVCKAVVGHVRGCAPIPCVSLGRRRLIRRESLRQWLEANERVANSGKLTTLPVRDAGKRG